MIELHVDNRWCEIGDKVLGIRAAEGTTFHHITNIEIIEVSQRLIKAATELLPDECKGEIELLKAVHSKLDSKETK